MNIANTVRKSASVNAPSHAARGLKHIREERLRGPVTRAKAHRICIKKDKRPEGAFFFLIIRNQRNVPGGVCGLRRYDFSPCLKEDSFPVRFLHIYNRPRASRKALAGSRRMN